MKKKNLVKLIFILLLLAGFPLLWLFNQRINYRKVLTLDTKYSLNARPVPTSEISSPSYVLAFLKSQNITSELDSDVSMSEDFEASSRLIKTDYGPVKVYEYEQAKEVTKFMQSSQFAMLNQDRLLPYKNLIIYNIENSPDLKEVLGRLK